MTINPCKRFRARASCIGLSMSLLVTAGQALPGDGPHQESTHRRSGGHVGSSIGQAGSFNGLTPGPRHGITNHRPLVQVAISPAQVPADDAHATVITLDASGTLDPENWQTLSYSWNVPGAHFVQGTLPSDRIARITVPGGHALPVQLVVSDNAQPALTGSGHAAINVSTASGVFSGPLVKWHTLKLTFLGSRMNESDDTPNPFLDRRLDVTFFGPQGEVTRVPGFFNGNGQGSGTGRVWQANFAPRSAGLWSYQASFRAGPEIAVSLDPGAGSALEFDGTQGSFQVLDRDPQAPGFLSKGLLEYTGEHYLKHVDGGYFLKGGTDSPENLLGFKGFDDIEDAGGIGILHEYPSHVADWEVGDPQFTSNTTGVSGKGLIGALNYLSAQHVNSIYFLPMNLGGDGQDTHPFLGSANTPFNKRHYDISRMAQWSAVFEHAQEKGILLHFVLGETEAPNQGWLSAGTLGVERKLFYRELVARFASNLAIKWNISEENNFSINQLIEFAGYIQALDPYDHPIAVHTHPNNFQDYWGLLGNPLFSSTSIQFNPELAMSTVEDWRTNSAASGRKWVIEMDENNPAGTGLMDTNTDDLRKRVLYDVYFSGGQLEWYFGYHNLPLGGDLRCEDFRTRSEMWEDMWHARNFMQSELPFWEMEPQADLLSGEAAGYGGAQVFTKPGEVYAVYLPNASSGGTLDLSQASGLFRAQWFNPRNGTFLSGASVVVGGTPQHFDAPPLLPGEDWVLLVRLL